MKDKVKRFIENIGGNFVEISYRDAIYQCMDLTYAWVFVLDIPKATIQNQYAYQVWTKPKSITKEYFDLLENTPDFVPVAGDLAVWKKEYNGTAGHIGIVSDNNNDVNGFNVFEQNNPVGANPRIRRSSYNHIAGFLRPKVQAVPQPEPIITDQTVIPQIIDENGNAMPVHAVRSSLSDSKRDLKACQESMEGRVNEAVEKERAAQLKNCDERLKQVEKEAKNEYSQKIENLRNDYEKQVKDLKLEIEKMVWKKVADLPASTLFVLGIKKLIGRGK